MAQLRLPRCRSVLLTPVVLSCFALAGCPGPATTPENDAAVPRDAFVAPDAFMPDAGCATTEYRASSGACTALTVCTSDEYETTPPTATSDRECMAVTVCTSDEYESTPPTATTDRACTALTDCTAMEQEVTAPTATSDRVCGACGEGTANCDLDVSNGCEADLDTSHANCGMCGMACALDQTCGGGTCGPCTPVVVTLPVTDIPAPVTGVMARCYVDNSSSSFADCDVVQCGLLTTWALSYDDNRESFDIVTFEPSGTIVRQMERTGARYWWNTTLDSGAQTATFYGQGSGSVTVPWSDLR